MKIKGFTLIELLAVIVILAIIALIATPIILNVIGDTKDSSVLRSGELYLSTVETEIARKNLKSKFNPSECTIGLDGNLTCGEEILAIKMKGNMPSCGTITLVNGKISTVTGMVLDDYGLSKEENKSLVLGEKGATCTSTSKNAVSSLINKANNSSITSYTDGDAHEMYTFSHEATSQTEALTDYRYIGNNPYNYVTFNNETWRIIGVFTVEDENGNKEQRIKLMKDETIGTHKWGTYSPSISSFDASNLNTYLNDTYYPTLSDDAKSMIVTTKYYLAATADFTNLSPSGAYSFERGNSYYNSAATNYTQKVAVMYPSDYAYTYTLGVDNICGNTTNSCSLGIPNSSWMFKGIKEWTISFGKDSSSGIKQLSAYQKDELLVNNLIQNTINKNLEVTPLAGSATADEIIVWYVGDNGDLSTNVISSTAVNVRPVVYLSGDVQIDKGDGSSTSPYEFILK